ncbi:flocculation protein FLO11-like isoform X1 [Aphelenchoides avenae]|nr:flocculation protein FLO11-like isoform X1 [Aphelenchus avenae]
MAAELTTEQRTRLIQLVRQHPVLYDLRHAEYSNRDVKRELWEQIAEQLKVPGVNADVAATKWKNAKDNYDRIRKKVKARSSSGRVHPSRWVHYDQMRFLDHDDRPAARSRRLKAVTAHATLPSTQAAEQESFTDEPEEVKMETFELEEDNLCAHAASTNEKEAVLQQCHTGIQCNKCSTMQAQLEQSEAEKEQLRKANDQLKKGTDQMRAFIKDRGLSDAFIEFIMTPSV